MLFGKSRKPCMDFGLHLLLGRASATTHSDLKWTHDKVDYKLLPCQGSPCLWTVVPIRSGEDPSVKTSREELTRGVVITYVDDLLLTGWQHHIDAITKAHTKFTCLSCNSVPIMVWNTDGGAQHEGCNTT